MAGRRVNFYIDGLNLYYGSLRGTRNRWLDLSAMARRIVPKEQVNRVRYFPSSAAGA